MNALRAYLKSALQVSKPFVPLIATIPQKSRIICLAKSPNKHNRIYLTAEPLDENIIKDIEEGIIKPTDDITKRAKYLSEKYGWDVNEAKKIWFLGPNGDYKAATNIVLDCTKAVQYINEIKDHVKTSFQWVGSNRIR